VTETERLIADLRSETLRAFDQAALLVRSDKDPDLEIWDQPVESAMSLRDRATLLGRVAEELERLQADADRVDALERTGAMVDLEDVWTVTLTHEDAEFHGATLREALDAMREADRE
jgi:hypothetical protein